VDDIRNLTDQVRYPPQTGRYKIYIIDEVHMLSQSAFNAFLKTLEEPPSYAIFILATTEKHKILPTILSRCQIFDFNRIQPKDISDHLASIAEKEGIKAEPQALELIAQKADGGLRDALSMFDLNVTFSTDLTLRYKEVLENLHILDYDYYFKIVTAFLENDLSQALVLFDEIIQKGFDGHLFVGGLMEHFRNLLVCKNAQTASLLQVAESVKGKYIEQAGVASTSFLLSALSVASQCDLQYKTTKNQRLHVELCLMKLSHIPDALQMNAITVDETAKKKIPEPDTPQLVPATRTPGAESKGEVPQLSESEQKYTAPVTTPAPVAAQKPAAPPARPMTKLKSARAILSEATAAPQEKEVVKAIPDSFVSTRTDLPSLTQHTLPDAIRAFVDYRTTNGLSSSTEEVALNRPIHLNGDELSLALDNDFQLEKINEIKGELIAFLRSRYTTGKLRLEGRVAPSEVKRMPYTTKEKFDFLAEKNPSLLELKHLFGLEMDF
jgi:DNA polymerase-3 subunit gamma/tau